MPLYEVSDEGLTPRPPERFAALGLYERADLQRLLGDDISVLGEDLLVALANELSGKAALVGSLGCSRRPGVDAVN